MLEVADCSIGPRTIETIERTVIIASSGELTLYIGDHLAGRARCRCRSLLRGRCGGQLDAAHRRCRRLGFRIRRLARRAGGFEHRCGVRSGLQEEHIDQNGERSEKGHRKSDSVPCGPSQHLKKKGKAQGAAARGAVAAFILSPTVTHGFWPDAPTYPRHLEPE